MPFPLLAALLAAAAPLLAMGSERWPGLAPCALCLWQRWPHAAAVLIGAAALVLPGRLLPLLGMLAALVTAGIGGFHVGVEQKWWEGLATCTAGSISGVPVGDLLDPNAPVAAPVRCDEVPWALFGISMAGWNMLISLALAWAWLMAARARA